MKNFALRTLASLTTLSFLVLGMGFGIVSAQTADDYGTSSTTSGSTVYCPQLSTTFQMGARDSSTNPTGQVTEVQKFLSDYYDVNPDDIVTGYYGRLTFGYVTKFQKEQNLPALGIVGTLTRAAIAKVCGGASMGSTTSTSGASWAAPAIGSGQSGPTAPAMSTQSQQNQTASGINCVIGYVPDQSNPPHCVPQYSPQNITLVTCATGYHNNPNNPQQCDPNSSSGQGPVNADFTSSANLTLGGYVNTDSRWHVVAAGDVNGDGKTDIVWAGNIPQSGADQGPMLPWPQQASLGGNAALWLGTGTANMTTAVSPTINGGVNTTASWHVAAAADLNSDGKTDLIWQNDNGHAGVWWGNGGSNFTSGGDLTIGGGVNNTASWHVAAAADINGDGKVDLIWQNTNGHAGVWWGTGGSNFSSSPDLTMNGLVNSDTSWQVVGAADLNGDGKIDLIWQNTNGHAAAWWGNGSANFTSSSDLTLNGSVNSTTSWHVGAVADVNGDGKADLIWQNTNGTAAVWYKGNLSANTSSGNNNLANALTAVGLALQQVLKALGQ